jgi:hypothetical protein
LKRRERGKDQGIFKLKDRKRGKDHRAIEFKLEERKGRT